MEAADHHDRDPGAGSQRRDPRRPGHAIPTPVDPERTTTSAATLAVKSGFRITPPLVDHLVDVVDSGSGYPILLSRATRVRSSCSLPARASRAWGCTFSLERGHRRPMVLDRRPGVMQGGVVRDAATRLVCSTLAHGGNAERSRVMTATRDLCDRSPEHVNAHPSVLMTDAKYNVSRRIGIGEPPRGRRELRWVLSTLGR